MLLVVKRFCEIFWTEMDNELRSSKRDKARFDPGKWSANSALNKSDRRYNSSRQRKPIHRAADPSLAPPLGPALSETAQAHIAEHASAYATFANEV